MQATPAPVERFHSTFTETVKLISELNQACYNKGYTQVYPGLVVIAEQFLAKFDKDELIIGFINNSHLYWDQVKEKNEDFFMKNADKIFGHIKLIDLPSALRNLFSAVDERGKKVILTEDRDAIFMFFSSMIKICLKYIHEKRGPIAINNYTSGFLPEINLPRQVELWKIQLVWPSTK